MPLILLAGCTLERPFSAADFPCSAGGPCVEDAGVRDSTAPPVDTGVDAGAVEDARPMDAASMDAMPVDAMPIVDCVGPVTMPESGVASGNTTNQPALYDGACFDPGAPEIVYALSLPGRTKSLLLRATNPDFTFAPALHVYRDSCIAADRVGCARTNLDGDLAELTLNDLEPGDYAIVVDGETAGDRGPFLLTLQGELAAGEPCDPDLGFLTCEIGSCRQEGAGFACPPLLDCADGIDVDGDGMLDEDPCTDPPSVTCTGVPPALPGGIVNLEATATDDVGITDRRWSIVQRPPGSRASAMPPDQDSSFLRIDLTGTYLARYVAFDGDFQSGACELTVSATTADDLFIEAYWLDEPFDSFDLDLVLIHPTAPNWADFDLSCSYDCEVDWGAAGAANDPFWGGDAPTEVTAETIRLPVTEQGGNYGIGISAFEGAPREVRVNVYCGGVLAQAFGPMPLSANLFWKVADVSFGAEGCSITPLESVVTQSMAESVR